MSRRIRSIKPELLEDEKTAGLSDTAFRLFIGLITMADDFGTFRADARFVEKQVYWLAVPELGVATALLELESLATYYTVRGQRYGRFLNWAKHQRIDNVTGKRTGTLPGPEEADELPRVAASRRESPLGEEEPPRVAAGSDRIGSDRRGAEGERAAAPPESVREEPRSVTKLKSVPPISVDPDIAAVAAAIRADRNLAGCCDSYDVAMRAMPVGNRKPLGWLLEAVSDAGGEVVPGEQAHVTLSRLRRFLKAAKAPKREQGEVKGGSAYKDFAFDPGELGPARQKRRLTAQDSPAPPPIRDFDAMLKGFGTGPQRHAPPLTDAEREAKKEADKRLLAAIGEDMGRDEDSEEAANG